jgi:hypothetical protein
MARWSFEKMFRKVLPLILLVVASAMANAEKFSGFVSGSPSGKTFTLGAKGGPYKVDASKASVRMKGKFFSIGSLTGGSQVTVEGTKTGNNIMATKVDVGFIRGGKTEAPAKGTMPTTPAKGTKAAPMKGPKSGAKPTAPVTPPVKGKAPSTKGKAPSTMGKAPSTMGKAPSTMGKAPVTKGKPGPKPGAKSTAPKTPAKGKKPASTAKPKDNTKAKAPAKGKTDSKTKSTDKTKTGG